MLYSEPTTIEQAVDKVIALAYKDSPLKYYYQTTQDIYNKKEFIKKDILSRNLQLNMH